MSTVASSKKAMDASPVGIILALFVIITIVLFVPSVHNFIIDRLNIDKCLASVSVKSLAITIGSVGTRLWDPVQLNLECPTEQLIVGDDQVYDNYAKKKVVSFDKGKLDGLSYERQLKTVLADKEYDCARKFHQGRIDPFARLDGTEHCVMCADVQFDASARERLKKEGKVSLDDFNLFLWDNYADGKTRYAEFIYAIPADKVEEFKAGKVSIGLSEQHAVIFYSGRGGTIAEVAANMKSLFAGGSGADVLGIVFGTIIEKSADGFIHKIGVDIVPLSSVQGSCTQLY